MGKRAEDKYGGKNPTVVTPDTNTNKDGVLVSFLTSNALSAISNTVTIVSGIPLVVDYVKAIKEEKKNTDRPREDEVNDAYFLLDDIKSRISTIEGVELLFDGDIEKELLLHDIAGIGKETNTNPIYLMNDLEQLLPTMLFDTPQEAADYDASFRQLLHSNGITQDITDGIIDQIHTLYGQGGISEDILRNLIGEGSLEDLIPYLPNEVAIDGNAVWTDQELIDAVMKFSSDLEERGKRINLGVEQGHLNDLFRSFDNRIPVYGTKIPTVVDSTERYGYYAIPNDPEIKKYFEHFMVNSEGKPMFLKEDAYRDTATTGTERVVGNLDDTIYQQYRVASLTKLYQGYNSGYKHLDGFRDGEEEVSKDFNDKQQSYDKMDAYDRNKYYPQNSNPDVSITDEIHTNAFTDISKIATRYLNEEKLSNIDNAGNLNSSYRNYTINNNNEANTEPFTNDEQSAFGRMPIGMVTFNQEMFSDKYISKIATASAKMLQGVFGDEDVTNGQNVNGGVHGSLINKKGTSPDFVKNIHNAIIKTGVVNKKDLQEAVTQIIGYVDKKGLGNITLHQHAAKLTRENKAEIYNYIVGTLETELLNGTNVTQYGSRGAIV